jgi:hypothetical protein
MCVSNMYHVYIYVYVDTYLIHNLSIHMAKYSINVRDNVYDLILMLGKLHRYINIYVYKY